MNQPRSGQVQVYPADGCSLGAAQMFNLVNLSSEAQEEVDSAIKAGNYQEVRRLLGLPVEDILG